MATETIKIPLLSGGVSTQPAHLRLVNQTRTGDNVVHSVLDGCSKRPGSRYVCAPTLTSGSPAKLHPIHRDDSEKYNVVYQRATSATIQVFTTAGTACAVFIGGASQTYLDSGSASAADYRFVTIADYTLIGNAQVAMGAETSPSYAVAGDAYDYDSLISKTPVIGTYWRTRNDSISYPSGYFQYLPGGNTYATILFPNTNTTQSNISTFWNAHNVSNPVGFQIFFSVGGLAVTGATWTAATRTLTKTGQFANVAANDWVNVTGGTGATAGYYQIESKTSSNTVILKTSVGATDQTNYTFDGVGKVASVVRDFQPDAAADMREVAKNIERAIRDALGGLEACVEWIPNDPTDIGSFRVTSPYAGTSASFPSTGATRIPTVFPTGITALGNDLTNAAGDSFYAVGATIVAGTGDAGPTTGAVSDRWARKPAPNQKEAVLTASKMPQQMIRLNPAGTYSGGYLQFTRDLQPFAYWRFGEASGTIAADYFEANNGTYTNTPTLGATGALNGDTNTAVTLNGTTQYVDVGALTGWGGGLSRPFTFEAWVKITDTTESVLFGSGSGTNSGYFRVEVSYDGLGDNSGFIWADLLDKSSNRITIKSNATTTISNGSYHHLVVTMNPASGTAAIYLDGVAVTSTVTPTGTCTNFQEFVPGECAIGARTGLSSAVALYITGTVDEAAIYQGSFSAAMAAARYNQGTNASYSHNPIFGVFPVTWVPRLTGDAVTNTVPNAIKEGRKLSDLSFFRNRVAIGANERVFTSQDGDFFNLFLENANNITDSDRVEKVTGTRQVTIVDFLTPIRKSLLVTTRAGRQFELGTGTNEQFTPTTGALAQSTSKFTIQGVRPDTLDTWVYLPGTRGSYSALFEYHAQESVILSNADEVSAHVQGYLPTLTRIATCGNENYVLCLGSDSCIYAFRFFIRNDSKEMAAWSRWTYTEAYTVRDISVIGTDLYLLVNASSAHTIERIPLAQVAPETNFPFVVNADRTFSGLSGAFAVGNTTWTLPFTDNTINRVVKSDGTIYVATSSGGTVTVTGVDLSASTVLIGRSYDMSVELSRAYRRDVNGVADIGTEVDHRETVIRYSNSGDFTFTTTETNTVSRAVNTSITAGTVASGEFRVDNVGNSKTITNTITSSDCRPVNISSIQYAVETTSRSNP